MEKAIKLALKGGYEFDFKFSGNENQTLKVKIALLNAEQEVLLLDPLFWRALGKALDWEAKAGCNCNQCQDKQFIAYENMQKMIKHLWKGGSIENYFEKLLKE